MKKRENWKERALEAEASLSFWRVAYKAAYDEWYKLYKEKQNRVTQNSKMENK